MAEPLRVVLLIGLAAAALTTAALVLAWWMEPVRRMKRALLKSLGATPEAEALSPSEGRAAGLDFDGAQIAVLWNRGGSGLVYAFEEIEGDLRSGWARNDRYGSWDAVRGYAREGYARGHATDSGRRL